jgi:hypothetical protein
VVIIILKNTYLGNYNAANISADSFLFFFSFFLVHFVLRLKIAVNNKRTTGNGMVNEPVLKQIRSVCTKNNEKKTEMKIEIFVI